MFVLDPFYFKIIFNILKKLFSELNIFCFNLLMVVTYIKLEKSILQMKFGYETISHSISDEFVDQQ